MAKTTAKLVPTGDGGENVRGSISCADAATVKSRPMATSESVVRCKLRYP